MVDHRIHEGIVFGRYPKDLYINLDIAKQLVAERLILQNGKSYPAVIHLNGMRMASKEARAYMAKEGVTGITMGAFVVGSSIERVILNFFLTLEKPPVPAKAFTNEEDAVKWIKENRVAEK